MLLMHLFCLYFNLFMRDNSAVPAKPHYGKTIQEKEKIWTEAQWRTRGHLSLMPLLPFQMPFIPTCLRMAAPRSRPQNQNISASSIFKRWSQKALLPEQDNEKTEFMTQISTRTTETQPSEDPYREGRTFEFSPARSKEAGVFIHWLPPITDWAAPRGINYPALPALPVRG